MGFSVAILVFLASSGILAQENKMSQDNTNLDWWQTSVIYQIYPRSFKDSNGDGIGDLKGIEENVDHFVDIGVGAVWLSPIYRSPMADFGYDISDFKDIDPVFGTMNDFISLKDALHSRGIRLILDFVPNHSSDEHEWFQKSINKIPPYTDYYVWLDPKEWINHTTPVPPNNWVSAFEGSAWEYVPKRQQFYLHQFAIKQPDLNYRCQQLKEEMMNVLRFWLDLGVDGFRFDAVAFLVENEDFLDETVINNKSYVPGYPAFDSLDHKYTLDQPETYDLISEFRKTLDEYSKKDGRTRLMLTETYSPLNAAIKYYGTKEKPGAHMTFNFGLITYCNRSSDAETFNKVISNWMERMTDGKWANWVIGNHDQKRVGTRYGEESADIMNMILMLLPGTAITYNGEEIDMTNAYIRWDQTVDVAGLNVGPEQYEVSSRDPERTPFQWDTSRNAGFSNTRNKTWLPVNPNYWKVNLETQKASHRSHYKVYKKLTNLRTKDVFKHGDLNTYVLSKWVFAFTRCLNNDCYVIVINLGTETERVVLHPTIPSLNEKLYVHISSINSEYDAGMTVTSGGNGFEMRPKSSLILANKLKDILSAQSASRLTEVKNAAGLTFTFMPILITIGFLLLHP